MFTKASKYAIKALIYMSFFKDNPLQNITQISKATKIPEQFLGKIFQQLAKNKILMSKKGINGGFKFLKSPDEITFYQVIKIIDGEDVFNECVLGFTCDNYPEYKEKCYFHAKLDPLIANLKTILSETTIANYSSSISLFDLENV